MSKKGKYYEKLVELIETSINPDSKVQRDVMMPIIDSNIGAEAQCDIVITESVHPREFITIVEVQNRTRKTDVNTFRGWVGKLERVGAQRLICVSRKGFSDSVKEEARKSKGSIILIQLSEIPKENLPIGLIESSVRIDYFSITDPSFDLIVELDDLILYDISHSEIKEYLANINSNNKVFSFDGKTNMSLTDLCRINTKFDPNISEGHNTFDSELIKETLYITYKVVNIRVDIDIDFKWNVEHIEVPIKYLEYKQDDFGALAWLIKAEYEDQNGQYNLEIPITKNAKGRYMLTKGRVDKPENFEFNILGFDRTEKKWQKLI